MDTLTQAALGATVGQAFFARRLGRKANWYGALGGLMPDFDVVVGALTDEWGGLVWHRGPSHAVWFGPVLGPLLGWLCWRWYRRKREDLPPGVPDAGAREALPAWIGLWILALLTHPLLDVCTTYGTQLLAPFDRTRYAIDAVSIIDPLYTGVLALALIIGWKSRRHPARAARAGLAALALSTAYLAYGLLQNHTARDLATADLTARAQPPERIDAYPTFFQPWLRRLVAWYPDHLQIGAVSTLHPRPITWTRVDRPRDPAIDAVLAHPRGEIFRWFANDRLVARLTPVDGGTAVDLGDYRYVDLQDPTRALWGIRATVAADGEIIDGPTRYRNPRPAAIGPALRHLWESTFPD